MNLSPAQSEQLSNSLSEAIAGEAFFDRYRCSLYSTDASMYSIQPWGVVLPKSRDDVVVATQFAAEHGIPLIPRGAGTSLSGQSIGAGIVIDFSKHMNRILNIDPQSRTARVQPGVILEQLNQAAGKFGLQFGPDVATINRANLGGMIGNNSAGARSIHYGRTVDHVISLESILADGSPMETPWLTPKELDQRQQLDTREGRIYRCLVDLVGRHREAILRHYPHVLRRVSGYNLDEFVPECRERVVVPPTVQRIRDREAELYGSDRFNLSKLIIGAEGSLATVTEAELHLVSRPNARGLLVMEFATLADAIDAVGVVLKSEPSAIELFDSMIIELAAGNVKYRNYLDFVRTKPESLIIAEFSADDESTVRARLDCLSESLRGHHGLNHMMPTSDPEQCEHIWACRKAALPLLMGIPGSRKPIAFVEDTAVDPTRLPEFVARFREIIRRAGTDGAFYGHASVGCLHIRPLIDTRDPEDLARMRQMLDDVAELVLEFGGSMSGEHGDGLARSWLNERLFGTELYSAFREIKRAFDPQGLMNPGKVVDGPDPADNLRLAPDDQSQDVTTTFDFSRQGGFIAAAELCNGSGVCRKMATGTMCPSFMATGDEEHSTRGRANALRMVLSGKLPAEQLYSDQLYGTFDLCLQCKGCKAECPSNVDVAKLKSEFLSLYHNRRGTPFSARLMGNVGTMNRWGAAFAPVSNWLPNLPGARWAAHRLFGVDPRRPLPTFHRNHFRRWFRADRAPSDSKAASRGEVLLLDDCLTSYCEPNVNRAAVEVLEAAGYEVQCAGLTCCGRAMISKGQLGDARRLAEHNIKALLPWVERGVTIVGCEPSCLLTLADDYLDLVPGSATEQVAARAMLIDDFLAEGGNEVPLTETGTKRDESHVLLHGHCHQKALVGASGSLGLLEKLPGTNVKLVDSGCCGMAGSFGYEHYDLSMKIAKRVLLPAIEAQPESTIAAPGFSCRHQIQHGSGRRAYHPIELVANRLAR